MESVQSEGQAEDQKKVSGSVANETITGIQNHFLRYENRLDGHRPSLDEIKEQFDIATGKKKDNAIVEEKKEKITEEEEINPFEKEIIQNEPKIEPKVEIETAAGVMIFTLSPWFLISPL